MRKWITLEIMMFSNWSGCIWLWKYVPYAYAWFFHWTDLLTMRYCNYDVMHSSLSRKFKTKIWYIKKFTKKIYSAKQVLSK